jgi:hypothetical protein
LSRALGATRPFVDKPGSAMLVATDGIVGDARR